MLRDLFAYLHFELGKQLCHLPVRHVCQCCADECRFFVADVQVKHREARVL